MLQEVVERFNRYREPEAVAEIVEDGEEAVVEIRGSFCRSCGLYDYAEDLIYFGEELNVKVEILSVEELEDGLRVKLRWWHDKHKDNRSGN